MVKVSTRIVFIFKKFVIKIPISYRGYLQCKNEKILFDKYKNLDLLAELYWEKFGVICMKKYNLSKERSYEQIFKVKEKIKELDIDNCDLFKINNWGIENNKYYLIDYGINERISKMYKITQILNGN